MFLIRIFSIIFFLFLEKWINSVLEVLNSISFFLAIDNKPLTTLSSLFLLTLELKELVDKDISSR